MAYDSNRLVWYYTPGPAMSGELPIEPPTVQIWQEYSGINPSYSGAVTLLLGYNPGQVATISSGGTTTPYSGTCTFVYLVITLSASGTFPLTMYAYAPGVDHSYSPESEVFYVYHP